MQALILCGGKGERLRPLTSNIPKPMIKINGKPILEYIIDHILLFGIKDFILTTGYQSQVIEDYIRERYPNINIIFSNSGDVDIIKWIQDILVTVQKAVIVLYGDIILNVDINDLISHHRKSSKEITMTVWPLKLDYGLVEIAENGTVESFAEKPTLDKWINIGYFYINMGYRDFILSHNSFESFLLDVANRKSINGFRHQ